MPAAFLAALIAVAAVGQPAPDRFDPGPYDALRALAGDCRDPVLRIPVPRGIDWERDRRRFLAAMLRTDPSLCPGVAQVAFARLRAEVGEPERGDVDFELLELAWSAAEHGRGTPQDPALADRYGRILWLFAERRPDLPRWSEADRAAWLVRPETVALLRARNADGPFGTRRSLDLEGGLLLRRDLPFYDGARAVDLLEESNARGGAFESRQRLSVLLTDGDHVPPDYPRAARLHLGSASTILGDEAGQAELLRIGSLAAAAARTPVEQAQALRILFAAGLNGLPGTSEAVAGQLRRIGRPERASLDASDAAAVTAALGRDLVFSIPLEDDPPEISPIRLRGLIGPDGRLAYAEVAGSSGSRYRDRVALGAWARYHDRVDFSATSRGRFVWVDLPPVDSRPD